MDEKKVVLGISGGVDSAASALLLKEAGYEVYGLYFDVVKDEDPEAKERAESICRQLDIPFIYKDLSNRFSDIIINPFCKAYEGGCTPMPCINCNPYIKWNVLKEYADDIHAKWLATGHYAGICEIDGIYYITKSANSLKDQSYMLAKLDQSILSRAKFPLSDIESKEQIYKIIDENNIEIPEGLKESQDICFIKGDYRDFLKDYSIQDCPGYFVDTEGNILGKHNGYSSFTIGQGKGFGMGFNKKMYVKDINPYNGNVMLCEDKDLYTYKTAVTVESFAKYGNVDYLPDEYDNCCFEVKIRYSAKPVETIISSTIEKGIATLIFKDAQRAPTPGQYAVFYKDDIVIGCGVISKF